MCVILPGLTINWVQSSFIECVEESVKSFNNLTSVGVKLKLVAKYSSFKVQLRLNSQIKSVIGSIFFDNVEV